MGEAAQNITETDQSQAAADAALDFEAAWSRILSVTGAKTQIELARIFDIRQSSISDAKRRKSIPDSWLVQLVLRYEVSPAWILHGGDAPYLCPDPDRPAPLGLAGQVLAAPAPVDPPAPEPTVSAMLEAMTARLGEGVRLLLVPAGMRVSIEPMSEARTNYLLGVSPDAVANGDELEG